MKVFLIGFMGSGKTTTGKELAQALGYQFIDLDTFIEEKYNKTIKTLFEYHGEDYFRKIENDALLEVTEMKGNMVIASGGGTSCFYNSVEFMNSVGITIYLRVDVAELLSRLIASKRDRPLLWGKTKEELNNYIIRVLDERKKYYEMATITIEFEHLNIDRLASTIKSLSV